MLDSPSPSLAKIKKELSETEIRALLTIAVAEVCNFFNVGKNMNDTQIALTVDLIIERFWYFKLEEIKYCFHRAMMHEQLFDRLDGNIIIRWLIDYDSQRTEEAMRISDREASMQFSSHDASSDSIPFCSFVASLTEKAKSDPNAESQLQFIHSLTLSTHAENQKTSDHDFKLWRIFNYLPSKK